MITNNNLYLEYINKYYLDEFLSNNQVFFK